MIESRVAPSTLHLHTGECQKPLRDTTESDMKMVDPSYARHVGQETMTFWGRVYDRWCSVLHAPIPKS